MADLTLSREEAKRVYDAFGAKQDAQAWYEDPAINRMLEHAHMRGRIFEWGCGTGRLGKRLTAFGDYSGVDLSETMIRLAQSHVGPKVRLVSGAPRIEAPDGSFDRVVSTYVLDLMSEEDIRAWLAEAKRVLAPDGRLCLVGLTEGERGLARLVTWLWRAVHRRWPAKVGGCRPLRMERFLGGWRVLHRSLVTVRGIASEAIVASPTWD